MSGNYKFTANLSKFCPLFIILIGNWIGLVATLSIGKVVETDSNLLKLVPAGIVFRLQQLH